MDFHILLVPFEQKHILRNLLEIYLHDMSEFDDEKDPLELNDAGLYGYGYLDYYWNEKGRYPYLLTADGKPAGLSFIRTIKTNPLTFEVAEFFVVRKYRKTGAGTVLISKMFEWHKGEWVINTPIKNTIAQHFWRKAVKDAAAGEYKEYPTEDGRRLEWAFSNG